MSLLLDVYAMWVPLVLSLAIWANGWMCCSIWRTRRGEG